MNNEYGREVEVSDKEKYIYIEKKTLLVPPSSPQASPIATFSTTNLF
jgi:hypothetical protein